MTRKNGRGAKEVSQKLIEIRPESEKVDPEVLVEGRWLLVDTARILGDRVLSSQEMQDILAAMIDGTPFKDAKIVEVAQPQSYDSQNIDAFGNMSVIMGEYASGTDYNVWFARENGEWILKFSRVPQGGNWRGGDVR